jgi:ribose transport system substrate-binding protein
VQKAGAAATTLADDYSALKQADQIDGFVKAGVDVILLTPADPDRIADAIGRAHDAGIAVVTIDGPAAGADAQVATDNAMAGTLACTELARAIGGHGQVAILGGPPSPAATARSLGCADAFARVPDIHVASLGVDAQGTREGAQRAVQQMLGAGQIDAVFAINDAEALGAADVATDLGRATVVVGTEGSPTMQAALGNRARANVIATAATDPYAMGDAALHVAVDVRNGREPPSAARLLDPRLVTRDAAADYKGWLAERQ